MDSTVTVVLKCSDKLERRVGLLADCTHGQRGKRFDIQHYCSSVLCMTGRIQYDSFVGGIVEVGRLRLPRRTRILGFGEIRYSTSILSTSPVRWLGLGVSHCTTLSQLFQDLNTAFNPYCSTRQPANPLSTYSMGQ